MPVAVSIQWKPLRDPHYVIAGLLPGGGGLRQIFAQQSTLRELQALARGNPEQSLVGLLLGKRLDCSLTLTPYVLIESHVGVAATSFDERAISDAIRTLREQVRRRKSIEVLGWYSSSRATDAAVSRKHAAVHAACFAERWQTVLTFGDGGNTGAFFLYDSSEARWFHAPFFEVTVSKSSSRAPKPTCVAWPAYLTTASVVPLVAEPVSVPALERFAAFARPVARPVVRARRTPARDALVGVGRAAVAARRSALDLAKTLGGWALAALRRAAERIARIRAEWAATAARRKAEADAARAREEERQAKEAAKRRAALEEAQRREAEAAKRREAEAEARRAAQAEARRKAAEEAGRRRLAEEEARRRAAEEAERRRAAEAEAKRKAAEEEAEARRKATEEAERRRAAEAEARRQAAEAEARRRAEEAEKRRAAEAEAQRKAAEEAQRRAAEDAQRRAAEEAQRRAAELEARRKADEEARRKAAEEEQRRAAEAEARRQAAEAEARRQAAEAEARRLAEAEAEARRLVEAEAEARRQAAEAEARREAGAEAKRVAAEAEAQRHAEEAEEAEADARRREAEAEEDARRTEAEAQRLADEAEAEAKRKATKAAEDARRKAAEAEALRISVEVAAIRERLARPPVEGSKPKTSRVAAAPMADLEDTTPSDGPYRYLALARREGFEVSEKIDRGSPEHPETVWLLHEREFGLRLIVTTTDDEVREASLHYNMRTEDDSLLEIASPEHRDAEPRTVYGREECLKGLRARCRRLRATGALERDWKASPSFQDSVSAPR
jgi:hypothetical protein